MLLRSPDDTLLCPLTRHSTRKSPSANGLYSEDEIVPWLGALPDVRAGCDGWHDMNLQFAQDDSGI